MENNIKKIEEICKDKKIERNTGSEGANKVIYLNLGAQCNQNCNFCLIKGSEGNFPFMPLVEAKRIIKDFAESGGEMLMITGGEPTLYPELDEVIAFADLFPGIKQVSILTNATAFADGLYTEKIIGRDKSNKLGFSVSFHSHIAEVSDKITQGMPGDYGRTVSGLANISKWNRQISVYHAIVSDNFNLLPDFVEWINVNFPNINSVVMAYPFPQGNADKNSWIYVKFTELKPYLLKALHFLREKNISSNIATCGQFPLCIIPEFEEKVLNMLIFFRKNVAGTVGKDVFHETEWSSEKWINNYKNKSPQCDQCILNEVCQGFWKKYTDIFGFDGVSPVTRKTFEGNIVKIDLNTENVFDRVMARILWERLNLIIAKGDDVMISRLKDALADNGVPAVVIRDDEEV
ncbi:MAG: radical SAM protein [Candidatus Colwellbacteria bacterium]|nr:radical SAM protein [Candidatus Colwellbacteria bacterium]